MLKGTEKHKNKMAQGKTYNQTKSKVDGFLAADYKAKATIKRVHIGISAFERQTAQLLRWGFF